MKLRDFVSADRVVVPLDAATVAEATEALLARIEPSADTAHVAKLRRRMDDARGEDLLVMPGRAFLLHYRAEAVPASSSNRSTRRHSSSRRSPTQAT